MKFKKETLIEDYNQKRIHSFLQQYREALELDDSAEIDADNLDSSMIRVLAAKNGIAAADFKDELVEALNSPLDESLLLEDEADTVADKVADAVGADDIEVDSAAMMHSVLDSCLEIAEDAQVTGEDADWPNVLFYGDAGVGKSSIIRQWAKRNNVNLVDKKCQGMESTDIGGALAPDMNSKVAIRLSTGDFDNLQKERSVLFLDELNRAPSDVTSGVLELINSHIIPDSREDGGVRHFPNFLFTVAACNPPDINYDTNEIDTALKDRFAQYPVTASKRSLAQRIKDTYAEYIQKALDAGKADLAKRKERERDLLVHLLQDPRLKFDTSADIVDIKKKWGSAYNTLSPRALVRAVKMSKGDPDKLLADWDSYANPGKKGMIKQILADYHENDDKANSVLKKGTESSVFSNARGNLDKLRDRYSELADILGK